MRSPQPLSISLPNKMADWVRAKITSGEYVSESDVIWDGCKPLTAFNFSKSLAC